MTATLDQRRARHAWDAVQAAKRLEIAKRQNYGRQAKRLPVRIITAGLGPALAFLNAKDYAPALLQGIGDWVLATLSIQDRAGPDALIRAIIKGDADFLRRATEEAQSYLLWLVRFAEAEGLVDGAED